MMSLPFVLVAALAAVVIWRAGCVAVKISGRRFGCPYRFQAFAIGYAALALGAGLTLAQAWQGSFPAPSLALLTASALLVIFDPRRPT